MQTVKITLARYSAILVLAIGVALPMTFCTAPIEITVREEDSRLVIYSTLTDEYTNQRVSISRTVPYFLPQWDDLVRDATVTISTSEGDTYNAVWSDREEAYMTTEKFSTAPGVTYSLNVECDGDGDEISESYSAATTVIEPNILDGIGIERFKMSFGSESAYIISIYGKDRPGRDYYIFRVAVDGELKGTIANWIAVGDRMFQNGAIDGFPLAMFPGGPDEDEDRIWFAPGDRVALLVSCVDEDFMRFVSEVQSSSGGSNPMFGGPPYNMRTNIEGGAIGYFGSLYSYPLDAEVPY